MRKCKCAFKGTNIGKKFKKFFLTLCTLELLSSCAITTCSQGWLLSVWAKFSNSHSDPNLSTRPLCLAEAESQLTQELRRCMEAALL